MSDTTSTPAAPPHPQVSAGGEYSPAYRNYVLFIITIGLALNFLDRQIITLLMPSLKAEFNVSDTTLGFLSGFAFAAFYVTLGLPLAYLADRGPRRVILAGSMVVWSAMTALCGAAQSFWHLALARFGVGAGEAGFTPSALSMLADYFPPEKHAGAVSVSSLGIPAGVMLGLAIGGFGLEYLGWRGAFMIAGLPGIVFGLLFYFTVREPRRRANVTAQAVTEKPRLSEVVKALWKPKPYRLMVLANCASCFGLYGMSTWIPSLLMRSYGMEPQNVGYVLALTLGVAGAVGALLGGYLADRFSKTRPTFGAWLSVASSLLAFACFAVTFLSDNVTLTVIMFGIAYALGLIYNGPIMALIYKVLPAQLRATGTGVLLFCINLAGLGLGPFVVGMISDYLTPTMGEEALRQAMLIASGVYLLAALFYVTVARTLKRDIETRDAEVI